jgi:phage-related protein
MTYSFRFQIVENITKAGAGINQTFQSMARQAQMFTSRVNLIPSSIDRLESELKQLQNSQRLSFDLREIRRYGQEIEALQGRIRRLRGEQQETRPGLSSRFGFGGIGRAAAGLGAVFGIREMAIQATNFNDGLVRANGLIAGIMRSEEGILAAQRQAFQLAAPLNLSRQNSLSAMAEMLTVTRGNVAEASNLVKMAKALEAINPAEGFEGAVFALKEIQSGDTMSLRERFNIRVPTQEEAKKIAAKDGRSVQQVMFDSLQQYLDQNYGGGKAGQGVEFLLNLRANTIGGQMQRIANTFQNIFTPMLLPFLQETTVFLKGIGDWVQANEGAIKNVLGGVVDGLAPIFNFGKQAFGQFIEYAKSLWPIVQPLAESIGRLIKAVAPPILQISQALTSILRPAIAVTGQLLTWLFQSVAGWMERNQSLVSGIVNGIGTAAKVVLGLGVLVVRVAVEIGRGIGAIVGYIGKLAAWAWENNPFAWMVSRPKITLQVKR